MADLFQITPIGTVQVIQLELPESLDSDEFDRLNDSLAAILTARPNGSWVIDLSVLAYAGSSILGLLVNLRQRIKLAGGRLVLCGLSEGLLQTFRTCSLERLFIIRRSRDEAVERAR
jgi:anti-anti-sigma factor